MVPRALRGSVVGSSMDMWCPYGIGRESWDRGVPMLVDPGFSLERGRAGGHWDLLRKEGGASRDAYKHAQMNLLREGRGCPWESH